MIIIIVLQYINIWWKWRKVFKTLIGEWVWDYKNWCVYIFNIMKPKKIWNKIWIQLKCQIPEVVQDTKHNLNNGRGCKSVYKRKNANAFRYRHRVQCERYRSLLEWRLFDKLYDLNAIWSKVSALFGYFPLFLLQQHIWERLRTWIMTTSDMLRFRATIIL